MEEPEDHSVRIRHETKPKSYHSSRVGQILEDVAFTTSCDSVCLYLLLSLDQFRSQEGVLGPQAVPLLPAACLLCGTSR